MDQVFNELILKTLGIKKHLDSFLILIEMYQEKIAFMLLFMVYLFAFIKLENNHWFLYTRVMSTFNASQCVYIAIPLLFGNSSYQYLFYEGNRECIILLYNFSHYLFVDTIFLVLNFIRNKKDSKTELITGLLHHIIGGLGIYSMATKKLGLGLGLYFAMTEMSTPFLNLSWVFYNYKIKNSFSYFIFGMFYFVFFMCRIVSIPYLVNYLYINYQSINTLPNIDFLLAWGGCATLICLNITWFIMLTKKMINLF